MPQRPKKIVTKISLDRNGDFIVKDDKVLIWVVTILFFAIFLYGVINTIVHNFKTVSWGAFIFILPSVYLFTLTRKNRIHLKINKNGIFHGERFVTSWKDLVKAYLTQKKTLASFQDNFILVIEYTRVDINKVVQKVIPLTNTQNKSEEEVMAVIRYFVKLNSGAINK